MYRRFLPALVVLALAAGATPAFAKYHVIAAKSAFRHGSQVYITHALAPGHSYKIVVRANGKRTFSAQLMEAYTYMSNGHLGDGTKVYHKSGKTTATINVPAPSIKHLSSWQLVTFVVLKSGKNLQVQYVQTK